jgi:hypothetical protein
MYNYTYINADIIAQANESGNDQSQPECIQDHYRSEREPAFSKVAPVGSLSRFILYKK